MAIKQSNMNKVKHEVMNQSTLSSRQQTTIAAEIVRKLGLSAGQKFNQFIDAQHRIVLEPVGDVATAFGALKTKRPFKSVEAETEGMEAAVAKEVALNP